MRSCQKPVGAQTVDANALLWPFSAVHSRWSIRPGGISSSLNWQGNRNDHHNMIALIEAIPTIFCKGGAAVEIIRIQLDDISPTTIYCGWPHSSSLQSQDQLGIMLLQVGVLPGEIDKDRSCSICRVVINNNDVESKIGSCSRALFLQLRRSFLFGFLRGW